MTGKQEFFDPKTGKSFVVLPTPCEMCHETGLVDTTDDEIGAQCTNCSGKGFILTPIKVFTSRITRMDKKFVKVGGKKMTYREWLKETS